MREEEEPFAGDATIVDRVLTLELTHQPLAEVPRPETHGRNEAVLEDPPAVHANVAFGVGDQG